MIRNLKILFLLIPFIQFSCGGENVTDEKEKTLNSDTITTDTSEQIFEGDGAIYEFEGFISNEYPIYLQYKEIFHGENETWLEGFYFYTKNNSGFPLSGTLVDGEIDLSVMDGEHAMETFRWTKGAGIITGMWFQIGEDQVPLELTVVNNYSHHSENFLAACKQVAEQYPPDFMSVIDYETLNYLYVSDKQMKTGEDFDGYFAGNRIELSGSNESGGSGFINNATYVLLPGTNSNVLYLADLEIINGWLNDQGDSDNYEDDQYGLDPFYEASVCVYKYENDEIKQLQKVNFDGDGLAGFYYFNERAVLLADKRKDVLYYSKDQIAFVEH